MRIANCGLRNAENCSSIRNPQSEIRNFVRNGFTLVELVLVCVVIGILLAASIPRFQHTADRLRTERTAVELTQLLRVARERAVTEDREIIWRWDQDAQRARLLAVNVASDGSSTTELLDDRFARSVPLPPQVSVIPTRDGSVAHEVSFFPDGTSQRTVIEIMHDHDGYTVTIDDATGQAVLAARAAAR